VATKRGTKRTDAIIWWAFGVVKPPVWSKPLSPGTEWVPTLSMTIPSADMQSGEAHPESSQSCFCHRGGKQDFADEYRRKTGANAFGGKVPDFALEFGEDLIVNFCGVEGVPSFVAQSSLSTGE